MDGGFTENERAKIAKHLRECRFCHEASEGLALIPDPFGQKAAISSMRKGLFRNMRNKGRGRERKLWPGRKMNVAAIAAGIVLLTGVFSVYTFLVKRERNFVTEDQTKKIELLPETETATAIDPEKSTSGRNTKITEAGKPVNSLESKKGSDKNPNNAFPEKEGAENKIITDEESLSPVESDRTILMITEEEPEAKVQAAPLAKANQTKIPQFKSKETSSRKANKSGVSIKGITTESHPDSLNIPEFISDEYKGFNDYILSNLNKSSKDLMIPANGEIMIRFLVTRNGKIRDAQIIKGLNPEIDKVILQLILKSPKWSPANQKGKETDYLMNFTIHLNGGNSTQTKQ